MTRGNQSYWYVFEAIGSVRQLTDTQSQVPDAYFYDAWGNELTSPYSQVSNPFRYVGKHGYYLDTQSALMLLGVRYYSAGNGKFISIDPRKDVDRFNFYNYAKNNPLNLIDPSGELSVDPGCAGQFPPPPTAPFDGLLCNCGFIRFQILNRVVNNICAGGIMRLTDEQWKQIFECAQLRTGAQPPRGITWQTLRDCMKGYCERPYRLVCKGSEDPSCSMGYCAYSQCDMGRRHDPFNQANIVICVHITMPCRVNPNQVGWDPGCGCQRYGGRCGGSRGHEGTCMMLHEMAHGCGFCSGEEADQRWVDAIACCIITRLYH